MKKVVIRLANENDADVIALLGRVCFSDTFGQYFKDRQDLLDYFDRTFSVVKMKTSLSKANNVFWIAFVDDLPVGFAKLKLNSSTDVVDAKLSCQLQKIYVYKDFLAEKIGTRMQDALLAKAKELGFEKIWLSVLNENQRAIRFYLKNDFEKVGEHDFSIGKEDFNFAIMTRAL